LAVQRAKSAQITHKNVLFQRSSGVKDQMNQSAAPGCPEEEEVEEEEEVVEAAANAAKAAAEALRLLWIPRSSHSRTMSSSLMLGTRMMRAGTIGTITSGRNA
jgi:hypothetical protein